MLARRNRVARATLTRPLHADTLHAPQDDEGRMQPSIYGPYQYVPITERKGFKWPNGARVALWVIPNIEFFHLDDPMPGTNNERIARAHAKIPNVRNWALRDYGNRVGVWRFMEVMSRYGVRGTA